MRLLHGRVSIELHTLKPGKGRPLLLLHALGASAEGWPSAILDWSHGPVYALDFAGHGKSGRVHGGAYNPEYFLADADLALEYLEQRCVVVGAGIGAYVALLLGGSRADQILTALLLEGPGLVGGGSRPRHELEAGETEEFESFIATASSNYAAATDPLVAQCERDVRPNDYVTSFAEAANRMLFSTRVGSEIPAPEWWSTALLANRGVAAPEEIADCLDELELMATSDPG